MENIDFDFGHAICIGGSLSGLCIKVIYPIFVHTDTKERYLLYSLGEYYIYKLESITDLEEELLNKYVWACQQPQCP